MKRLYETHLAVRNLERSIRFYCEVVGLKLAFTQSERGVAFLWIGSREEGMLGLWAQGSQFSAARDATVPSHFAIQVTLKQLFEAPEDLKGHGVVVRQFGGQPADEPSVIGWMPSAQIYFTDLDGHSVEYITLLNESPDPDFTGSWSEWKQRTNVQPGATDNPVSAPRNLR